MTKVQTPDNDIGMLKKGMIIIQHLIANETLTSSEKLRQIRYVTETALKVAPHIVVAKTPPSSERTGGDDPHPLSIDFRS